MSRVMHCDIVSVEGGLYSGQATMIIVTGSEGDLGITPGHAPLITALKPGPIRVINTNEDKEEIFYLSGGFIEVQATEVKVLSDTAMRAGDMDEESALEAKKKAEKQLSDKKGDFDYSRAAVRLAEAAAQLRTLQAIRKKIGKS